MTASQTSAPPAEPDRKPRDDEIDVYGLTHPGKVRTDNQDHFLICALRKQMVVQLTSLPAPDHLMAESERLAFLVMVADGVGGGAKGAEASRMALEAVTQYVTRSMRCYYAADSADDQEFSDALEAAADSATGSCSAAARRTPTTAAWPRRSPSTSASGPAPTCSRWATAAATCCVTAS